MWFHSRFPKAKRRVLGTKLALEILEDRLAPATFTVTTTLDVLDASDGKLSLREAITRANNLPGADTIVVPAGVYKISIPAGPGPVNDTGAFDILDSATLQGAGTGATIVDAQHIDRVFAVTGTAPSSIKVTFRGLTVRGGLVNGDGGGIVVGNADLTLVGCVVTGNTAFGNGAGISNALNPGTGNLTLVGSTVSRNVVGGDGGGIFWVGDAQGRGSNLSLSNSRVPRNSAEQGGGILADTATLTNSTVSGNSATTGNGGGIDAATATLTNSTVSGNAASGGGGGIFASTRATLTNSTVRGNTANNSGGGGINAFTLTLTNSTVSGNTAVGASSGGDGGGIRANTATLTNSTVSGNSASTLGGGINAQTATLTNSTVSGNFSTGSFGGGINAFTLTLTNCTVSGNSALLLDGGGINAFTLTLTNCTVSGNSAAGDGGGIHADTATLTKSTVSGNSARNGDGGGIHAFLLTLTNSTVSGNTAGDEGGGIKATTATLTNTTISGNTCRVAGGGIYADMATLTNSTVSGNSALVGSGGGIYAHMATLTNCTITENSGIDGGGIFHFSNGTFSIKNTIIAQNFVAFGRSRPDVSGAFVSQGHNLIGDGTGSSDFSNNTNNDQVGTPQNPIDPKLGPLANNGGPTKTHALLAGSTAIDRGDNSGITILTDQRGTGFPRIKDGDGNGSRIVDIGAFER